MLPTLPFRALRSATVAGLVAGLLLAHLDRAEGRPTAERVWLQPNGDLANTRAASLSPINATTVGRLIVKWRFRLRGKGAGFGNVTSTPIIAAKAVYVQDSRSNVLALDRGTGRLLWARIMSAPNDGPNGLSLAGDRIYTATDTTAFALDAKTGGRLWTRRLARSTEQFVGIAPVVSDGRVYLSTQGFAPGGRGALYALDAASGRILWRFQTVAKPFPTPEAGGGGAWNPLGVDRSGNVYAGIANPGPWGGSPKKPNGGWFGPTTLYTDSLVVLEGASGHLQWYDQVTPHDVRDYDFHVSPILANVGTRRLVIGAGKAGIVIAWDRETHARVWSRPVGRHLNDVGPLPRRKTLVCPGLFGGVLTPMSLSSGRLFVPVVDLCMKESGVSSESVLQRPPESGEGKLYALDAGSGQVVWARRFDAPLFGCATSTNDVVIAPAFSGEVVALAARDGKTLWKTQMHAGVNSCPALAGNLLVVGAGSPHRAIKRHAPEIVAFGLPESG
jgi:outer membrane protein assembly factor BamB